jgi:hypothetical protein
MPLESFPTPVWRTVSLCRAGATGGARGSGHKEFASDLNVRLWPFAAISRVVQTSYLTSLSTQKSCPKFGGSIARFVR